MLLSIQHIHHAKTDCFESNEACVKILRYGSSYRMQYLYRKQLEIMQELQVPILDYYEASYLSAHQLRENDSIHYKAAWNNKVMNWFFL
jgi:hypothetical protein